MSELPPSPATANPALQQFDVMSRTLAVLRQQFQQQFQDLEEHLQESRAALEAQLDDRELQQRLSTLESEAAQLAENLKEQRAGRETAERRLAELHDALETEQQHLTGLQQELSDRSTAMEAARDRVKVLEKQAKQHDDMLAAFRSESDAERARQEEEIATLREQQTATQISVKEKEQLAAQAREQESVLEQTRLSLSAVEEEKNGLAAALATAREQCEDLGVRLKTQEQAAGNAQAERKNQAAEVTALHAEIAQLQQELSQRVPVAEVEKLRTLYQESLAKTQALEEKLQAETSRGNKALIASQLAEALRDAELASDEITRLRRELDQLRPADDKTRGAAEVARVKAVITRQANHQKRTLGDLLVEAGIVTLEQVNECLDIQKRNPHQHFGAILIARQLASEDAIAHGLAYQCGVEFALLEGREITEATIRLLNERLVSKHRCIPIDSDEDKMTLAMANPVDLMAIEDIERATGKSIEVVVSTEADIKAAIAKYY